MTQENKRTIDQVLENSTVLLETIVSDVIYSTEKIFGSHLPGEMGPSLFEFKNENFLDDFTYNFELIKSVLEKEIATLPYEKSDEVLILANLLLEIKEFDLATVLYENLIKQNSENYFAWANLMSIHIYKRENEKAMECYLHLPPDFIEHSNNEKKNPENNAYRILNITSAYPLHSTLSALGGRIEESTELKQQYEKELRALYSMNDFVKGQEALANNNFDEAFILFSSLLQEQPDSHLLLFFTGKAAAEGKHHLIAEENFKKAIQLKNDIPEYWNELAESFFSQHKNDQGIKALKTALTLDSSCKECWGLAGRTISILESLNEYDYFIKQIQLMPSPDAIMKFVDGLISRKRFENALEVLQIGVSKFPEDTRISEHLALVYERMGKFDEAISIYEDLLMDGKSVQKYLQKITSILSILHDDKRLVRILKMVSSYLPWDETTLWNKIGDLLMRAKDYLGASEAFRKVVSFDENDPTIQFNLALAYQELKLFKKAEETYRKVLELNPKDHAALNNFGNVLKEMKRYDEAIEAYQTAIEIEPIKAISWANLGILYEELKLKNEARECYQKAKDIALKNKDYKTAAKFEEWENSV